MHPRGERADAGSLVRPAGPEHLGDIEPGGRGARGVPCEGGHERGQRATVLEIDGELVDEDARPVAFDPHLPTRCLAGEDPVEAHGARVLVGIVGECERETGAHELRAGDVALAAGERALDEIEAYRRLRRVVGDGRGVVRQGFEQRASPSLRGEADQPVT